MVHESAEAMIDAGRLARVSALFEALVDESEEAIDVALTDEADTEVAAEVRRLIAVDRDTRRGDTERLRSDVFDQFEAARAPAIPRYRLTGLIGRGGMGSVYRGERIDGSYVQTVAIKCLQTGWLDERQQARFSRERQILAQLDHPGIARILDGGETDDHRPFIVMEHIDGENIRSYCEQNGLCLRDRLALMAQLCDAVQFAHDNLVVHRDIKVANILVSGEGQVKLLDFGVAMLMRESGDVQTLVGSTAAMMTPAYASPEQLEGDRVGAASDVYSLGVVLYELISGARPFEECEESTGRLLAKMQERPPRSPSRMARTGQDAKVDWREIRGDVETIALKALEYFPSERYGSAAALGDDLRAYLANRTIAARPRTVGYILKRFCQRNPALATLSGVLVVTLMSALGVFAWQNAELTVQRDEALSAQQRAEAVSDFLINAFENADPTKTRGREVTAEEILRVGAESILESDALDPATRLAIAETLAQVHRSLGLFAEERTILESAWTVITSQGISTEIAARVGLRRARLAVEARDFGSSDAYFDEVRSQVDGDTWDRPYWRLQLLFYEGARNLNGEDRRLGLDRYREAVEYARNTKLVKELPQARFHLAEGLFATGEEAEAELVLEVLLSSSSASSKLLADAASLAASIAKRKKNYALAASYYEKVEAYLTDYYDPGDYPFAGLYTNIANLRKRVGDLEGAETYSREALAIRSQYLESQHPRVVADRYNLALILMQVPTAHAEADVLFVSAINDAEKAFGSQSANLGIFLNAYGEFLLNTGRHEEATEILRRALSIHVHRNAPRGRNIAWSRTLLAESLLIGKPECAESAELVRAALETFLRESEPTNERTSRAQRVSNRLSNCVIQ